MAAEVYEDALELTVPILEAVLPDSEQYLNTAYPYPSLRITGRMERRRFRTIVLENPYLRATIVPDLGGRILRIFDKRTNVDIFPDEPLTPIKSGSRGVEIAQGIQIRYTTQDRPNSLGTVNYQLVQAVDEEDDAGVWIGEVSGPLSFNALISFPPDAAEIKIELRMFNRVVGDTVYDGGLTFWAPNTECHFAHNANEYAEHGYIAYAQDRGCSIWCDSEAAASWCDGGRLNVHRFGSSTKFTLGARQLDTWRFTICPHTTVTWPFVASRAGALMAESGRYRFYASRPASLRLQLTLENGESFDAVVDARPDAVVDLPFEHAGSVARIMMLSDTGELLMQHQGEIPARKLGDGEREDADSVAQRESEARRTNRKEDGLAPELMELLPSYRYEGSLLRAQRASMSKRSQDEVEGKIEQALLYNGEDHLAWWIKGVFRRRDHPNVDELSEILNAHYLAPLEPALRAEGFLNQPHTQGRDPNPILRPLTEVPEHFVDIACHLFDWWLFEEAARFIDEALRHMDIPMLRYLMAHALRGETRMVVESAAHVTAAGAKPFGPPFPWRRIELHALRSLAKIHPYDERLHQYLNVANSFSHLGERVKSA